MMMRYGLMLINYYFVEVFDCYIGYPILQVVGFAQGPIAF